MAPQMVFTLSPCQEVVFLTPLIAYPSRRSCPSPKNICQSHPGDSPANPWGHHITNPPNFITIHFRINFASPRGPYPPPKKKKTQKHGWPLNDPRVWTITTSQNNKWETFKTLYDILLNWLVHRDPEIIGLWNNPQYKLGYDALYINQKFWQFLLTAHMDQLGCPGWKVSKKVHKQVIITPINPKKKQVGEKKANWS